MTANLEGFSLSRFLLNENWTTKKYPKITAKEKIQAVKVTTEIEGGIDNMYKYSDYVYDTGFAEGEAKGIL